MNWLIESILEMTGLFLCFVFPILLYAAIRNIICRFKKRYVILRKKDYERLRKLSRRTV